MNKVNDHDAYFWLLQKMMAFYEKQDEIPCHNPYMQEFIDFCRPKDLSGNIQDDINALKEGKITISTVKTFVSEESYDDPGDIWAVAQEEWTVVPVKNR